MEIATRIDDGKANETNALIGKERKRERKIMENHTANKIKKNTIL